MTKVKLEQFLNKMGLRPVVREVYRNRSIMLAETDLEMDKKEYPWGYYQTAWFTTEPTSEEKVDGGSWAEFDAMHDTVEGWTPRAKRQARLQLSREQAQKWIDQNYEVGRYG